MMEYDIKHCWGNYICMGGVGMRLKGFVPSLLNNVLYDTSPSILADSIARG